MATYKNKLKQPLTVDLSGKYVFSVASKGRFQIPDELVGHAEIQALTRRNHIVRIDKPKQEIQPVKKPAPSIISPAPKPVVEAKSDSLSQGDLARESGEKAGSEDAASTLGVNTIEHLDVVTTDDLSKKNKETSDESSEQKTEKPKGKFKRRKR